MERLGKSRDLLRRPHSDLNELRSRADRIPPCTLRGTQMSSTTDDFVSTVAREISSGIDRALGYWLGRIEVELVNHSVHTTERVAAIEAIVDEYKQCSGRKELGLASAGV